MRHDAWVAIAALGLGGCGLVPPRPLPPAPPPLSAAQQRDNAAAARVAATLLLLQQLGSARPAEQTQIVDSVHAAYEHAPAGPAQLRYALVLALPGQTQRDPQRAELLLRALTAAPQSLAPAERALAQFELAQLDRELALERNVQRLDNPPPSDDANRLAAAQRHLQAASEENARLHRQLQALQAKLDAIASIERNITERTSGSGGHQP